MRHLYLCFKFCFNFVSIHAPGRGATNTTRSILPTSPSFNSRTREGCDLFSFFLRSGLIGFNSRTREGCDPVLLWMHRRGDRVSIHAPGRGATRERHRRTLTQHVSIHAPGRGATRWGRQGRRGCRVSIHAPGRGATEPNFLAPGNSQAFQFTHPGGVRRSTLQPCVAGSRFQFTHPGGVRPSPWGFPAPMRPFQFTHPGGVRPESAQATTSTSQFQFTHPGGVRLFPRGTSF